MVEGMSDRPPIPLVTLALHYREFKSKRDRHGLQVGPYRSQAERVALAYTYLENPDLLVDMFVRSTEEFSSYENVDESFIGSKRSDPPAVSMVSEITSGPKAASYLARTLPGQTLEIEGANTYVYIDREIVPARTTAGRHARMANHFDDEGSTRSTGAMRADLLLRREPDGRPSIGEVKVSSAKGDDADPVYGLVQALALASQLASASQRTRLCRHYPKAGFAETGPLDVLILLFRIAESDRRKTHRERLVQLAAELCALLNQGLLRPHVERVALVNVKPQLDQLHFAAWLP